MHVMDKQVLIVEDNKNNMNMVCELLGDIEGLTIFKAENSERAYKYAIEYDIELFIVDIILDTSVAGDVSGIRFVERIRTIQKYKFTPVIVTTSLEDPKLHTYSYLHCYKYFEKPYDKTEFKNVVLEALSYFRPKEERKYLYYKNDGILYSIMIKNIVYIVNHSRNITIQCSDCELSAPYKSCKQLLEEISSEDFIQCSKNTIVNKAYIMAVDAANRYIILTNDYGTLEIGPRIKKKFMNGLIK